MPPSEPHGPPEARSMLKKCSTKRSMGRPTNCVGSVAPGSLEMEAFPEPFSAVSATVTSESGVSSASTTICTATVSPRRAKRRIGSPGDQTGLSVPSSKGESVSSWWIRSPSSMAHTEGAASARGATAHRLAPSVHIEIIGHTIALLIITSLYV